MKKRILSKDQKQKSDHFAGRNTTCSGLVRKAFIDVASVEYSIQFLPDIFIRGNQQTLV